MMEIGGWSPDQIQLLLDLATWYDKHPADAFEPSPALTAFMADESPRILVRAANRTGKTVHAVVKLVEKMCSPSGGHRHYRAVGVSYKQSVEVISKLLRRYLPDDQLAPGCSYSETNGWTHSLIRLKNGTTCQIKSSDQKAIAHAGDDLDGVWFDEIPKPDIWLEGQTRVMSKGGFVWVTATPIGRPCGWFKTIIEAPDSAWVEHQVELSYANCPWYSKDQVDAWIAECSASPWAFRQKVYGDWEGETVERTFTGFELNNVVDDSYIRKCNWSIGIGIDHGESAGKQVALLVIWDDTEMIVLDELVNTEPTVPEADAKGIIAMLKKHRWNLVHVDRWCGDINSAGKLASGLRVNDLLAGALASQAKLRPGRIVIEAPSKGPGSIEYGHKLINMSFMRDCLKVHERCTNLMFSLKHYSGDEEDLKHPLDALRYISQPVLEGWNQTSPGATHIRLT